MLPSSPKYYLFQLPLFPPSLICTRCYRFTLTDFKAFSFPLPPTPAPYPLYFSRFLSTSNSLSPYPLSLSSFLSPSNSHPSPYLAYISLALSLPPTPGPHQSIYPAFSLLPPHPPLPSISLSLSLSFPSLADRLQIIRKVARKEVGEKEKKKHV